MFIKHSEGSFLLYYVELCNSSYTIHQQRKVSLSTLQSKAAKRRQELKGKPVPKKVKKPKEAKVNGFTNDKMKDKQTLIAKDEQIEMEPMESPTGVVSLC